MGGLAGLGFELIDELPDETWNAAVAVNLTAPFLLCKRAVRRMVPQGGGVILNTASVAGLRGGRGGPVYTATKWGLIGLTQNIAATFGDRGIRCNAICPGPTRARPSSELLADLPEQAVALLTRDRDKPEPCPPEQVAAVAVFLATDDAARINGAAIPVDGGWIAF
jgi:NAD(P)-dependent dehydrogenase (short-subunit alcohol dehydrogenase family)